jgi:hypothetical protein
MAERKLSRLPDAATRSLEAMGFATTVRRDVAGSKRLRAAARRQESFHFRWTAAEFLALAGRCDGDLGRKRDRGKICV